MAPKKSKTTAKKGKGKAAKEPSPAPVVEQEEASLEQQQQDEDQEQPAAETQEDQSNVEEDANSKLSMEERMNKMKELRKRMNDSARANRQDLIKDTNTQRQSARDLARLERKRKQAEMLGERAEAEATGLDLERKRAWDYSIEDNEKWDLKQAKKDRRADFSFTDYDDVARRKYKKDIDILKPDLAAYNKQRAAAQGGSSTDALVASEDLYRDANSFVYADHKPTDDAIDRVIGKINMDIDKRHKFSRKRKNETEGDVTYINEKNKAFNKKLDRFYNKYTEEIRDSFERGTAL